MSAPPAASNAGTPTGPSDQLSGASSSPRRRSGTVGVGVAIAIAVILLLVGIAGGYFIGKGTTSSSSTTINLTETGSSLLYPLFNDYWFPNYTAPNVVLSADSTGSGTGQSSAEQGLVNIGASDAYLANASQTNLINFPVAISAQLIYYNLPGVNGHINFNGTLLGMIYAGQITTWDNPLILAAQNTTIAGELTGLSSQTIYVVARSDSSGDTYLFTSYCYMSWAGFPYKPATASMSLSGVPSANVLFGDGNSGMVTKAQGQPGSIAYIGISYEASAASAGLQYAAVGDNLTVANGAYAVSGSDYILPTTATVSTDANLGLTHLDYGTYGLALTLIMGGVPGTLTPTTAGQGGTDPAAAAPATQPYPIVNLEYALIKTVSGGNVVTSAALAATVAFMHWALSYGNWNAQGSASNWINAVHFVPLTQEVIGYDMTALASVQSST
ncbi:MAG TPA: substrate-binding domain-containing protein [Thermoplasmata archaeon]|nr:substrate-binding domain-containing protein [Thermoplasmata archaeon]